MRFTYYIKNCIWELILCTMISCSLSMIIFNGFYIAEKWQNNYLNIILVVVLTTAVCLLGAYNKKSILIAAAGGAAILAAGLVVVQQMGMAENLFRDQESNPGIYFLIMILTSLIVFLLCRTRIGTGILFIAGAFLASAVQFLYETAAVWQLVIFLVSAAAVYIYKNYQKNVLETETAKSDFGRTFAAAAIICMLVVAISSGIFYGIVKPLDPPERELKLITKYMALEVLEKAGIADTHIINDSQNDTDNINDNDKDSNKKGDKEDKSQGDTQKQKDEDTKDQRNNPTKLDDLFNQMFYAIKYIASVVTPLLMIPLIILLAAAAILTKLYLRKRWLKKLQTQEIRYQIVTLYNFYLKKFRKLKIRKAPEETALEFADRASIYLQEFSAEGISFTDLTEIFVKARYSQMEVGEDEYNSYLMFHKYFYKNCRKHLGTFKYILKFFTL